jgi:hypothetical protein
MANDNLQSVIDELDELSSKARTESDPSKRRIYVKKGLRKACNVLTKLERVVERHAEKILQQCGIEKEQAQLEFRAVVGGLKSTDLDPFRSKEELREFLGASLPIFVQQGRLSQKKIEEIIKTAISTFDEFAQSRVSADVVQQQVTRLSFLFCRPPEGGEGILSPSGGGPGGGGSGQLLEKACLYTGTLATIGAFILQIVQQFANTAPPGILNLKRDKVFAMLSLLMPLGFANQLENRGELPTEELVQAPPVPVPAGASA